MILLFTFLLIIGMILWFVIKTKVSQTNGLHGAYTIDDEFNSKKVEIQKEIDRILSKIGRNGLSDLSEKDKKRLDELSKQLK